MDLGLHQADVARQIRVTESTIWNWESGWVTYPQVRYGPAIISFLGYVPLSEPMTLREQLRAYRMIRGLSQRKAARDVGVDPSTWERWENETATPRLKTPKAIISSFVAPVVQRCSYHE
jgi:DNA-binding XRE family transcriptional regulator